MNHVSLWHYRILHYLMNNLTLQTYYIFQLYENGTFLRSQWEYIRQIISFLINGEKTAGMYISACLLQTFKDTVNS